MIRLVSAIRSVVFLLSLLLLLSSLVVVSSTLFAFPLPQVKYCYALIALCINFVFKSIFYCYWRRCRRCTRFEKNYLMDKAKQKPFSKCLDYTWWIVIYFFRFLCRTRDLVYLSRTFIFFSAPEFQASIDPFHLSLSYSFT